MRIDSEPTFRPSTEPTATPPGAGRRWHYAVLSALTLAVVGAHAYNHHWGSDFWEHAAIIRELTARPFSPGHPLLAVYAPHPFMTPWALAIALVARLLDIDPVTMLSLIAPLNVGLFLVGLWAFVSRVSPYGDAPAWALAFTLLLWGWHPWGYSGFLHLAQIGFTAPYPSVFALGLALITLAVYRDYLTRDRWWRLGVVATASSIVLLTHPVGAILLVTGLVALTVGHLDLRPFRHASLLAGVIATTAAAALLWPYYPFYEFATSELSIFHPFNRVMYEGSVIRVFPALVGVPALIARWRRYPRDPLVWMGVALLAVYVFGGITARWSYGRVISPLVLILHIGAADWIAARERRMRSMLSGGGIRPILAILATGLLFLAALANMSRGLVRAVPPALLPPSIRSDPRLERTDERYRFLEDIIDPGDVVLAEIHVAWPVPAFGGKIVAAQHPQAFVGDNFQRSEAVRRFLDPGTSPHERTRILQRYGVQWVLIDRRALDPNSGVIRQVARAGRIIREENSLVVVHVDRIPAGVKLPASRTAVSPRLQ